MQIITEDSLLLVVSGDRRAKRYIVQTSQKEFSTNYGQLDIASLVGKPFGVKIMSHLGHAYYVLKPTIFDIVMYGIRRKTQIIYPKDIGYLMVRMGIASGMTVMDAGTGSAATAIVLALVVGPGGGKVISFERNEEFIENARGNIEMAGMQNYVELHNLDIEKNVIPCENLDAAIIDVREPQNAIVNVLPAMQAGAPIAVLVPTANQVSAVLAEMERRSLFQIEVFETLVRFYKTIPARLRPLDRMVAHTVYTVLAKKGIEE